MLLSTSVRKKPVLLAARESGASGKKRCRGGMVEEGAGGNPERTSRQFLEPIDGQGCSQDTQGFLRPWATTQEEEVHLRTLGRRF